MLNNHNIFKFSLKALIFIASIFFSLFFVNIILDYENYVHKIKISYDTTDLDSPNSLRYYKKKKYLLTDKDNYKTVIIGSSRYLPIGSTYDNNNLLNLSITGSHLYDLKYFLGLVDNFSKNKSVIIGIDPWVFNPNQDEKRYKTEYKERSVLDVIYNLFRIKYFKQNMKLFSFYTRKPEAKRVFNGDGSMIYNSPDECVDVKKKLGEYLNANRFNYDEFKEFELSRNLIDQLDSLFIKIDKRKNNYIVWLQPLNPEFINNSKLLTIKEQIIISDSVINRYAKKNNIKIVGSFIEDESDACNFWDYKHYLPAYVNLIYKKQFK